MRTQIPAGFRPPAPPQHPQAGRAWPTDDDVPAGTWRHSRQIFFLGDTPFYNTAAVGAAQGVDSYFDLVHYNGQSWRVDTVAVAESGISLTLVGYDRNATAQEAAEYIAAKFQEMEDLVQAGTLTAANWPWKARAERLVRPDTGALAWALVIERGYPYGTGPGNYRTAPIWGDTAGEGGLVDFGANMPTYGGNDLIDVSASYFYPGELPYAMVPARYGMARAMLPLAEADIGRTTEMVPWEIPFIG